jgi:peptide/nickel transport system substrate-binding protein
MKKRTALSWIMVMLLAVSMLAAGCASPAPAPAPEETPEGEPAPAAEKVLVMGYERDAETLDHIKTAWYSDA